MSEKTPGWRAEMQQTYKQRQRTRRAEAETIELPTESLSDTDAAAELIAAITELIGE